MPARLRWLKRIGDESSVSMNRRLRWVVGCDGLSGDSKADDLLLRSGSRESGGPTIVSQES